MVLDNLAEYQAPEIYDAEYGSFEGDFNVFVGLKTHGAALDLACGTGRLTIALAKSGLICTGLDSSEAMLERAALKSTGLDISYIHGDMRDFKIQQKFDLISMAGNSFQALLTNDDQRNMLTCVKSNLKLDGIFAFNTRNPMPDDFRTTNEFKFWHSFTDPKGELVKVYGQQAYNSAKDIVPFTTKRIWPHTQTITNIELRFVEVGQLLDLLDGNGFEIISLFGDLNKAPFTEMSKNIIVIAKLKK